MMEKFKHFFGAGSGKEGSSIEQLIKSLYPEKPNYKNRFLVKHRNKYISISTPEVSCFVLLNQLVYLYARDGRKFLIDMMLDELEATLDPGKFFRVNRQSIVNTESISAIEIYAGKRLRIYPEGKPEVEIIVSREKVAQFKLLMDS
ncbi:MAG: LytTR family transcriptional regulator [Ignavibacteriales bacterium]|nr:LytTR family transcriptional regulator [Ignavibacteriales bacterium]